jgi:hypothetical protein
MLTGHRVILAPETKINPSNNRQSSTELSLFSSVTELSPGISDHSKNKKTLLKFMYIITCVTAQIPQHIINFDLLF